MMKKPLTDLQLLNMSCDEIDNYIDEAFKHITDEYELVMVGILIDKAKERKSELERNNLEKRASNKHPELYLEGLGLESDILETLLIHKAY